MQLGGEKLADKLDNLYSETNILFQCATRTASRRDINKSLSCSRYS